MKSLLCVHCLPTETLSPCFPVWMLVATVKHGPWKLYNLCFSHSLRVCSKYPDILRSLFTVAQSRRNSRIVDNVLGAVCRMITANQSAVPLDQVGEHFVGPSCEFDGVQSYVICCTNLAWFLGPCLPRYSCAILVLSSPHMRLCTKLLHFSILQAMRRI